MIFVPNKRTNPTRTIFQNMFGLGDNSWIMSWISLEKLFLKNAVQL